MSRLGAVGKVAGIAAGTAAGVAGVAYAGERLVAALAPQSRR